MPNAQCPMPLALINQFKEKGKSAVMVPIPVPSHIHYELLLQLLERQTAFAVAPNSTEQQILRELTATIRKAMAQQKQLEDSCRQSKIEIEYRWSLNEVRGEQIPAANVANYGEGNRPLA